MYRAEWIAGSFVRFADVRRYLVDEAIRRGGHWLVDPSVEGDESAVWKASSDRVRRIVEGWRTLSPPDSIKVGVVISATRDTSNSYSAIACNSRGTVRAASSIQPQIGVDLTASSPPV